MGHLLSVIKFIFVQRRVGHYARSKEIALAISQKRRPKVRLVDYLLYWWAKYCKCGCIKAYFRANLDNRLVVAFLLAYNRMITPGTFLNYVATAILGFLVGVFITFLYFSVVSFIVDLSIPAAFYVSVFLCVFLTIGLAFIQTVRCVTISVIPEIFTFQARSMLVSYALIMIITGPGSNIMYNTRQLTETMTCTGKQLKALTHNLTEIYMKPLRTLKHGIESILHAMKPAIDFLKSGVNKVKNGLMTVGDWIKGAFSWLNMFGPMCENNVGTPYKYCQGKVQIVAKDCEVKVFSWLKWMCNPFDLYELVCYPLKAFTIYCNVETLLVETVFPFFADKLKFIGRWIKTLFYVSVSFHHSFAFETNQSTTGADILDSIFHAERERLKFFFQIFDLMKLALGAYVVFILVSAFIYRQQYFYSMSNDNYHINKYMYELDWKRASVRRQTLFPLTVTEKMFYVSLFSLRLTIGEQVAIIRESFFLALTAIKGICLFLIDFTLHWIVMLVNQHGKVEFSFGNDKINIFVGGSGLWFFFYSLLHGFLRLFGTEFNFTTAPCLPQPIPPAYHVYKKAAYTVGFAWAMLLFQPFGLRFRNYIMSLYYPETARKRAVYLYNYILQTRGTLSLYIRRNIFRKVAFGLRTDKPSFRKWLLFKYPKLKLILPYKDMLRECNLCGYLSPQIKCVTPDCPAYYCKDCFKQINYICIYCNMPQDYAGSTVSEEEDSEEEIEDFPDKSSQPWWKFGMIASNMGDTMIEMRDLEEARCSRSEARAIDTEVKDYFDDSWRRDHWADIEEFSITWPDLKLWLRPEHQNRFFD